MSDCVSVHLEAPVVEGLAAEQVPVVAVDENADVDGKSKSMGKGEEAEAAKEGLPWFIKMNWISMSIGVLLYTGSLFGFAPMQLMLQDEGQYEEHCSAAEILDEFCPGQQNRLQIMYTAAVLTFGMANFPAGIFLDHLGPLWTVVVAGVAVVGGNFIFAFSDSQDFDAFVLAYVVLAFGGSFLQLAAIVSGFLTKDVHQRSWYVAVNNCLFDSSSVIYLFFYFWNRGAGASRQTILIVFALVGVVAFTAMGISWKFSAPTLAAAMSQNEQDKNDHGDGVENKSQGKAADAMEMDVLPGNQGGSAAVEVVKKEKTVAKQQEKASLHSEDDVYLRNLSFKQQIQSYFFWYIAAIMAIQVPRTIMYLGTAEDQLRFIDPDQAETYVTIFTLMNPASFVLAPFIGPFLSTHSFSTTFFIVHCLFLGFGVCVLIPVIEVQLLAFTFFTAGRSLVFSSMAFAILQINGPSSMGKSFGVLQIIASSMSGLSYFGVAWTNNEEGGDYFKMNLFLLILSFVLFPMTWRLSVWEKKYRQGPPADELSSSSKAELITNGDVTVIPV
jgi:LAT3 family solute carrier family 43 protein 3